MESGNVWNTSTLTGVLGAAGSHLVALAGGGGKSTALLRLVREKKDEEGGVVATTTTMMFARQLAGVAPLLYAADDAMPLAKRAIEALDGSDAVALAQSHAPNGKVKGLTPAVVDALWEARDGIGSIVVEADGSRGLSLKAFGVAEPQLPAHTTVVVVLAGLDVVGRPLDGEHVHRADLLASILSVAPGDRVTPTLLGRAVALQVASVRRYAREASVAVLLNKVDDAALLWLAEEAAAALLAVSDGPHTAVPPDRIVAGSILGTSYALLHP